MAGKLRWENVAGDNAPGPVKRASIPGGWLVMTGAGTKPGGITFVPDPDHRWSVSTFKSILDR